MPKPQQEEFLIEMQHRLISCVVCCENMVNIEVGKLRCGREQHAFELLLSQSALLNFIYALFPAMTRTSSARLSGRDNFY
jgi:hypothetical protein